MIFLAFWLLFFARNVVKWDIFCDFQTPCVTSFQFTAGLASIKLCRYHFLKSKRWRQSLEIKVSALSWTQIHFFTKYFHFILQTSQSRCQRNLKLLLLGPSGSRSQCKFNILECSSMIFYNSNLLVASRMQDAATHSNVVDQVVNAVNAPFCELSPLWSI